MRRSAIILAEQLKEESEVVADLNALFLMIGYVEGELERLAPGCVLPASNLRSSIVNEILSRTSHLELCSVRN